MLKSSIAVVLLVFFGTAPATADKISKQEQLFRKAMVPAPDKDDGSRMLDPGSVIRAYIKSGHVRRKPDLGADYVDQRKFRKPATLFGHTLISIEEEYLTVYIGCCVNPGIGAVIQQNGEMAELEAYLAANKCRLNYLDDPKAIMADLKITPKPDATYHHIRCRQDDIIRTE
jgi:hypothetical protein